jgi:hypothetical protein
VTIVGGLPTPVAAVAWGRLHLPGGSGRSSPVPCAPPLGEPGQSQQPSGTSLPSPMGEGVQRWRWVRSGVDLSDDGYEAAATSIHPLRVLRMQALLHYWADGVVLEPHL